ncbi:MAG: multiheme c-type cytochrome [Campylobacterota bacterium]|nr:multiheme c-type cytochrome [Campylobacterota bacterium]
MKFIIAALVIVSSLFAAKVVNVEEKFQKSESCKACHMHIVSDWEKSWHAKSHYKSDEYFKATTDYVSRKTRKSLNSVKVQCATCHNPRISVTSTDMDYEIAAVMGLDKGSDVNKALESDAINEGINCVVCHNIDKIHTSKDESKRGINRVEWTKSGLMSGPYDDAKSPYHKVEHRDFMDKKSDQLCFVCHANDRSVSGMVFTDMKKEYKKKGKEGCVDCHMGPKKMGIAATLPIDGGKVKKRIVRSHKFEGAHMANILKDSLSLKLSQKGENLLVTISNPQPHNVPSGFGARELVLEVSYQKGIENLDTKFISLTTHYTSKRGKPTIPHLAVKATKDLSIPAKGKRVIKVAKNSDASNVEVKLYYRLVNEEVRKILKLKGETWSRKTLITSERLILQ